jgi:hypothetical protein
LRRGLGQEDSVIEGFRIDVTADELVAHLDRRISHHHTRAQECETTLQRLQALETATDEEEEVFQTCRAPRIDRLERLIARHRNREVFLMFVRNHVVANEMYRLSEDDLRLLEWLPLQEASFMAEQF